MRRSHHVLICLGAAIVIAAPAHAAKKAATHDCTATGEIEVGPAPSLSILEVDYGAFSASMTRGAADATCSRSQLCLPSRWCRWALRVRARATAALRPSIVY